MLGGPGLLFSGLYVASFFYWVLWELFLFRLTTNSWVLFCVIAKVLKHM